MVGKLGENMGVARFVREVIDGTGAIAAYVHGGGRIGVLVTYAFTNPATAANDAFKAFARDVAMQVAAASPMVTRREDFAADVVEHELSIYKAQAAESGKPEAIQEKMAEGRLEKFYKEQSLARAAVREGHGHLGRPVHRSRPARSSATHEVVGFVRFNLGETRRVARRMPLT